MLESASKRSLHSDNSKASLRSGRSGRSDSKASLRSDSKGSLRSGRSDSKASLRSNSSKRSLRSDNSKGSLRSDNSKGSLKSDNSKKSSKSSKEDEQCTTSAAEAEQPKEPQGRRKSVVWSALQAIKVEPERRTLEEPPPLATEDDVLSTSSSRSSIASIEPAEVSRPEPPPSEKMAQGRRKSVVWSASMETENRELQAAPDSHSEVRPPADASAKAKATSKASSKKMNRSNSQTLTKRRSDAGDVKSPRRLSEKQSEASKLGERRRSETNRQAGRRASHKKPMARRKSITANVQLTQSQRGSTVDKTLKRRHSLAAALAPANLESEASPGSQDRKSLQERKSVGDQLEVNRKGSATLEEPPKYNFESRRPSILQTGPDVRRTSVLDVNAISKMLKGGERPSVLEINPRRMSKLREESSGSNRRPSRLMGLNDPDGKFRDNMTRRTIYSNVKQMMEDASENEDEFTEMPLDKRKSKSNSMKSVGRRSGKKKTLYEISKAVAQAARKVVLKTRIADLFCGISYEHQLREELARVTQKSLKERDWDQLMVDLQDIQGEIESAEESKGANLDLGIFNEQITQAISSLQTQQKSVKNLQDCLDEMQFIEEEFSADPEYMWVKLLDVKDEMKKVSQSTEEFSQMMMALGMPKQAGQDPVSDTNEAPEDEGPPAHFQEVLSGVPQDVLNRMKNTMADADQDNWDMQEDAARKELCKLGGTEHDLPHFMRALRAEAWSMCVDSAVEGLVSVSSIPTIKLKTLTEKVEEKLMIQHPSARERAQMTRRKRRQSFRASINRRMSTFNKKHGAFKPHVFVHGAAARKISVAFPRARRNSVEGVKGHNPLLNTAELREIREESETHRANSIDFGVDGTPMVVNYLGTNSSNGRRRSSLPADDRLSVEGVGVLPGRAREMFKKFARTVVQETSGVRGFQALMKSRTKELEEDSYMFGMTNSSSESGLSSSSSSSGAKGPLPSEQGSSSSSVALSTEDDDDPENPRRHEKRRSSNKRLSSSSTTKRRSSLTKRGSVFSRRSDHRFSIGAIDPSGYVSVFVRRGSHEEIEERQGNMRAIKSQYAGHMVSSALSELLQSISLCWSSIEEAATFLSTCGGDVGGDGRIAVSTLHKALQEKGYRRGCAEVCCLFQALGVSCTERSTMSPLEFSRLSNFADWHNREDDAAKRSESLLGQLELRRVLMGSMSDTEKLLVQLFLAFAKGARAADAAGRKVCTSDDDASDEDAALCLALHSCCLVLAGPEPESTNLAEMITKPIGLHIFVSIISLPSGLVCVRILATYILSQVLVMEGCAEVSLSCFGAQAKLPSLVDLLDAAQIHAVKQGSEKRFLIESASMQSVQAAEPNLHHASLSDLSPLSPSASFVSLARSQESSAGRDETRGGRFTQQAPTSFTGSKSGREPDRKFLMTYIWRPLLEVVDPEGPGPPAPIDSRFLAALFQLFQQVYVPETVVGPACTAVTPFIAASLHRLHAAPPDSTSLLPVLANLIKDFEVLEESHEVMETSLGDTGAAAQVHMLAVAFGGCRLLREQLAQLPPECDSIYAQRGERLLRMWRGMRHRLLLRWPAAKQQSSRLAIFEAIKKATLEADKEGLDLDSPDAPEGIGPEDSKPEAVRLNSAAGSLFEEGSIELELVQRLARRWQSVQALGRCVESSASLASRGYTPGRKLPPKLALSRAGLQGVRAQTAPVGTLPASARGSATLSTRSRAGTAEGGRRFKVKTMPWTVPAQDPYPESFRSRTATPRDARHISPLKEQPLSKMHIPRSLTATPRAAAHDDLLKEQVAGKVQLPDKAQSLRSPPATPRSGRLYGILKDSTPTGKVQLPALRPGTAPAMQKCHL